MPSGRAPHTPAAKAAAVGSSGGTKYGADVYPTEVGKTGDVYAALDGDGYRWPTDEEAGGPPGWINAVEVAGAAGA